MKRCSSWMGVVGVLAAMVAGTVWAGSLDPTYAPGPTMHTLEEIYQKLNGYVSPQTLSPTTTVVNAGYYAATNLVQVSMNLTAENIKNDVTIFGVTGTHEGAGYELVFTNAVAAMLPKTGQTTSYLAGDDGEYEKGVAWPSPRFMVQADTNTVQDLMTGLIWARNADIGGGTMTWSDALTFCEGLVYGGQTDWRLPNRLELESLIDFGAVNPALPSGHPFTNIADRYWSSTTWPVTTSPGSSHNPWTVNMNNGGTFSSFGIEPYVWPVRGGQ